MPMGMNPHQAAEYAMGLANGISIPAKPNNLVSRETTGVEEFKWMPGSTRETVYHHYSNGKTVSIERFKGYDGFVRVTAIELTKDGTYGVKRHEFTNEDS